MKNILYVRNLLSVIGIEEGGLYSAAATNDHAIRKCRVRV